MTFAEAIPHLLKGKAIRCPWWADGCSIIIDESNNNILTWQEPEGNLQGEGFEYEITRDDLTEPNWEVLG